MMSKVPSQLAAYADLFQQLQDCALLLDSTSLLVLDANPACLQTLGLPRERVIGRPLGQWIEPSAREDLGHALRAVARRQEPIRFDIPWQIQADRAIIMELRAGPLLLADRNIVLQVVARDVSFRREAELLIQTLSRQLDFALRQLEENQSQRDDLKVNLLTLSIPTKRQTSGQ